MRYIPLFLLLCLASCKKKEDPKPEPQPPGSAICKFNIKSMAMVTFRMELTNTPDTLLKNYDPRSVNDPSSDTSFVIDIRDRKIIYTTTTAKWKAGKSYTITISNMYKTTTIIDSVDKSHIYADLW